MSATATERRTYDEDFKKKAVKKMLNRPSSKTVEDVAAELGVAPNMLYSWKRKTEEAEAPKRAPRKNGHASSRTVGLQQRLTELESAVKLLTEENAALRAAVKVLAH